MTDALLPRLLLLAAGAVWQAARSRYYFHMLQLNSYRNERYAAWLSKNPSQRRLFAGLPVAAVTAVALTKGVTGMTTAALLLAAAAIYTVCAKKPEKKPFVITDRVKRQFGAAAGLLLGALLVVALVWRADAYWGAGALLLLLALPVPLALPPAANRLMAGRERRIADSFVQAAREKLLAQRDFTVIGVTGSYGKTSVKYILSELLCEQYNTLMTPESYNTTMGVVRTVNEKLRPQHQVFVCEMGARQVGDIKEICDIVQPTYGIITSVGIAHLETFRSTENIRKTKFELADSLPDTGLAFLNFDSAPIASAGYSRPHVAYGLTPGLDCYSDNITGAAALALHLGVAPAGIAAALRRLKPVPHRLELKNNGGVIVIDDAYNANPEGAAEAVRVLGSLKGRRRILVTPGMVELGENEYAANREFGAVAAAHCDDVIAVGRVRDALFEGLDLEGFPADRRHAVKNLKEALALLPELLTGPSAILLENDLTDDMEG